jgi:hypothetical protein
MEFLVYGAIVFGVGYVIFDIIEGKKKDAAAIKQQYGGGGGSPEDPPGPGKDALK